MEHKFHLIVQLWSYIMDETMMQEKLSELRKKSDEYRSMGGSGICYTYLLGWLELKRYYYGVRYRKNCHPRDLGIKYRSSSKLVKELWRDYGSPDIVLVHKVFGSDKDSAILYEKYVLKYLDVLNSDNWLNRNIGGAVCVEDCLKGTMRGIERGTNSFMDRENASICARRKMELYPEQSFSNPEFRRRAQEAKRMKKYIRDIGEVKVENEIQV